MPPKLTKQQSDKSHREYASQANNLKNKKKLISTDQDTYINDLSSLQTYFDEESNLQKRKKTIIKAKSQQPQENDRFYDVQGIAQCIACLDGHFEGGKYILDCRHTFCNYCFKYWSNISNKCPACHKISSTVLMILDGSSRVQNISPKYMHQNCQKCQNNYNQHQMYYCDSCNENCIHIYCEPTLMDEKEDQFWVCKECKKEDSKLQGKTNNNFEYCDQQSQTEQSKSRVYTFDGRKKQKSRERAFPKHQKKDKFRKNKGKRGI